MTLQPLSSLHAEATEDRCRSRAGTVPLTEVCASRRTSMSWRRRRPGSLWRCKPGCPRRVPGHRDHDDRKRTASQSTDVTILGSTLQRIAIMNRDRLIEVFRYESHLGADSPSRSAKALTCMIMICREVEWHAAFLAGRIGGEAVSNV
jgi:hypothetical protein